jgi:catechol 2,3-dioxygenase-like lactoylglutathione lyase family enzyme
MSERTRPEALGFTLHHVGIVVPDLGAAVRWYCDAFSLTVAWREPWTDPDSDAIGLPGRRVTLCGAGVRLDDARCIELHQFRAPRSEVTERRTCDLGFGHLALHVDDLTGQVERLSALGMRFFSDLSLIESGPLAGARWIYGTDPWGNVIELLNWAGVHRGIG